MFAFSWRSSVHCTHVRGGALCTLCNVSCHTGQRAGARFMGRQEGDRDHKEWGCGGGYAWLWCAGGQVYTGFLRYCFSLPSWFPCSASWAGILWNVGCHYYTTSPPSVPAPVALPRVHFVNRMIFAWAACVHCNPVVSRRARASAATMSFLKAGPTQE